MDPTAKVLLAEGIILEVFGLTLVIYLIRYVVKRRR